MSQPISVTVKHDGRPLAIALEACRIYMAGEFAGNVEVEVVCDPDAAPDVLDSLQVRLPGNDAIESTIAYQDRSKGVLACFHCPALEVLESAPEGLTLLWEDEPIADMTPVLVDSIPTEQVHAFLDRSGILETPPSPPTRPVRWVAVYPWLWLLPAVLLMIGAALVALEPGKLAWGSAQRFAMGAPLVALAVYLAAKVRVPMREIWFVPHERRVATVEKPRPTGPPDLANAKLRGLDEFAHVRIYHCRYAPVSTDDSGREEWLVALEGRVPFTSETGDIHMRDDALILEACSTEYAGERLAALVSHHTNLPILKAGRF